MACRRDLDVLVRDARVQVVLHDVGLVDVVREALLRFGEGRHQAALNFGCAAYTLATTCDASPLFKGSGFLLADAAGAV